MTSLEEFRQRQRGENRTYHRARVEVLAEALNARCELVDVMLQELRNDGGFASALAELERCRELIGEAHLKAERAIERLSR